mmetsp:Transcript_28294/g.40287  ORF Transcript_28294/g.40287 Transcript_28294/m.40287 type:complete len:284 (+) Transcript_28294:36-887(+)
MMMTRLLSIILLIIGRLSICQCNSNCTQLDRSRKLRAFILSGHGYDKRYHSARDILLNIGFDVSRYEPPGMKNPRWKDIYNRITGGFSSRFLKDFQSLESHQLKSFLLCQAWVEMVESAFPFSDRFINRANETWLNDYTFFFEDDIALHQGVQDPYCAIVTGMKINPASGVLYIGIDKPACRGSIVMNGYTYGTECIGPGLHAVGLRHSIVAPFIAAIRALQGVSVTDLAFVEFSQIFRQSYMLVGLNLVEGTFQGLFSQNIKAFPSIKDVREVMIRNNSVSL